MRISSPADAAKRESRARLLAVLRGDPDCPDRLVTMRARRKCEEVVDR